MRKSLAVWLLLSAHVYLLAAGAAIHSLTFNEPAHLVAGLANWEGDYRLYQVNPPLARMVASLPVLIARSKLDWGKLYSGDERYEFEVGTDFVKANGSATQSYIRLARLACIPFSLFGALICFRWAEELYANGLTALALWCFCPMILGHAQLITGDVAAAAFGIAFCYQMWHWRQSPTIKRACLAGLCLGSAIGCKFTMLLLLLLLPAYLIGKRKLWPHLLLVLLCAVEILLILYRFNLSPILDGLRLQNFDFAEHPQPSYLFGHFSQHGWWYYYLAAMLVKLPLGLLLLILLSCTKRVSAQELFVLGPMLLFLGAISAETRLSEHLRYLLPAFPFLFVWVSRTTGWLSKLATAAVVVSSLSIAPHFLSYFNEVAGFHNGPKFLLNSNVDWGQDLLLLNQWLNEHPEASPIKLAYFGYFEPSPFLDPNYQCPTGPGWYAISANLLYGLPFQPFCHGQRIALQDDPFARFRELKPVATIGNSIYIYRTAQ